MTEITCPLCNSPATTIRYRNTKSIYAVVPYNIMECGQCAHNFTFPFPTKEDLGEIYDDLYRYDVFLVTLNEKRYRAKKTLNIIQKYFPKATNILDVGCNYGFLVSELVKHNYRAAGIELNKAAVAACEKSGLDVKQSSIEDFLPDCRIKYDLIILAHVFEHLVDPDEVLKGLQTILSPGGSILILVPNSHSFMRFLFGKFWGWWQVPVHVNHFNLDSMQYLAMKCGCDIQFTEVKGGDSLMLLLNIMNSLKVGTPQKSGDVGPLKVIALKIWSFLFKYWYNISNEELIVCLSAKRETFVQRVETVAT